MSLRNGRQVQSNTLSLQLNDVLPAGTLLDFAGSSAPAGFFICDGSAVSRTTYLALFNNIGTLYGIGDGSTTFNLPDSRGRAYVGKDDMGGTPANRITIAGSGINGVIIGASGGSQTHTLTTPQIPSHSHVQLGLTAGGGIVQLQSTAGSGATQTAGSTQATGNGNAHNNTQPSLIINKIIKY